jgi:hypothetical protein
MKKQKTENKKEETKSLKESIETAISTTIDLENEKTVLLWKIGDVNNNIIPDLNMLKEFEKVISFAFSAPGNISQIFLPPYISVEKIEMKKEKRRINHGCNGTINGNDNKD